MVVVTYECSVAEVAKKLKEIVEDINANIEKLDSRGPVSKYVVPEEGLRGRLVTISYTSFSLFCGHAIAHTSHEVK